MQLNDFTVPLNSLESINTSEVRELIQNVTIFIGTIGDTINDEAMNLGIVDLQTYKNCYHFGFIY